MAAFARTIPVMDTLPPFPDINGPFRGSHALADGWLTSSQLRSSLLRRMFRDVYIPRAMEPSHSTQCLGASLIAPPNAVLTGCSAATVLGLELARPADPVEFVVPEHARFLAQRGMHVRRTTVTDSECQPWGRVLIANPLRVAFDVLINTKLRPSLPRTVGLLDALIRDGRVDVAALEHLLGSRHENGVVRAREALRLADPRAESIPESELRVWLTLGGLEPEVQLEVYDASGRFLGRLDLAFPLVKLAVEYDGVWHGEGEQPRLDAERRSRLMAAGWEFIVVTKDQLQRDPKAMVQAVHEALHRRARH